MPTSIVDDSQNFDFNPDHLDDVGSSEIVPIDSELPYNIQIPTSRLLDILTPLAPGFQQLSASEQRSWRSQMTRRLYPWSRPGFYKRLNNAPRICGTTRRAWITTSVAIVL